MNFKTWLETVEVTEVLPIQNLILDKDNIALAVHSLSQGRGPMTKEPVKVIHTKQGYSLVDGYHRTLETILRGEDTVNASVTVPDYDPYITPAARRYVYDPDDEFYGLEQFATRRELRSIMQ